MGHPTITFHGAAGMVTGSCYAIESRGRIVLVDCGMFQGTKSVRALNYAPFPFDLSRVEAVLVTHAHIDHSGLLPKLAAQGWRGPVHCTVATADLLDFMLRDTAHIQEFEVERLNRRNARRGRPAVTPIYGMDDAKRIIGRLRPAAFDDWVAPVDWLKARFWKAGHVLGSASVEVALQDAGDAPETTLLFSGDLGPATKAFHAGPEAPSGIDHLIVESTYGGRARETLDEEGRLKVLERTILAAVRRGGPILIPVFALERTQELLYDLDILFDAKRLPALQVFLDSPLAIKATEAFDRHLPDVNKHGTPHPFRRDNLHRVQNVAESRKLERLRGPAIILAGSGMCDAGRIRMHIADHMWRPETTLLLIGYQAPGTLGRLIGEGRKRIRIQGQEVAIAGTVETLDIYSGHADSEALAGWIVARKPVHGTIFITHGEERERTALAARLAELGFDPARVVRPGLDQRFALKPRARVAKKAKSAERIPPKNVSAPVDWHNRYAEIAVRLADLVPALPDDAARERLLARLERDLERAEKEKASQ